MALELLDESDRITVRDAELEDVPDPDKDTTYTLRPITSEKQREIRKRHTTYVPNRNTGRKDPRFDEDAIQDDLLDHAIESWTGIVHKGTPLPCERQYKLKLDVLRKAALLITAGLNRSEREAAAQADSFRPAS